MEDTFIALDQIKIERLKFSIAKYLSERRFQHLKFRIIFSSCRRVAKLRSQSNPVDQQLRSLPLNFVDFQLVLCQYQAEQGLMNSIDAVRINLKPLAKLEELSILRSKVLSFQDLSVHPQPSFLRL